MTRTPMRMRRRDRFRRPVAAALAVAVVAWGPACEPSPGNAEKVQVSNAAFPRPFHVIAHRGASAYAPENTLPAFRRALELGAFEVELDVQLSRDDALVLFHDADLERKTTRTGRVRDYPVADLRETDIGAWFDREHPEIEEKFAGTTLITLGELFDDFGRRLHYHTEIKGPEPEIPERLVRAIESRGLADRVTVTSFHFEQLERVRRTGWRGPVCWLLPKRADLPEPTPTQFADMQRGWIDRAVAAAFTQVGVRASDLSPELVRTAHASGLEVRAFGIKSDEDMERAIATGSNGMTINWPDRLIARVVQFMAEAPADR